MSEIQFGCCFCMEPIQKEEMVGVAQTDAATGGFVQQWFAHQKCFEKALHPKAWVFDVVDWENEAE